MQQKACDYLVIGAGAAGCVLAARLSENPAHRVILVEAGTRARHPLLASPGLAGMAMALRDYKYEFMTEPSPAMNGRAMRWTQGRGLGGGSAINGMVYMRGHSTQYDQWRQMGCPGWSFADVLACFKRAETHALGETRLHGGSGPIHVRPSRARLPVSEAFVATVAGAGIPLRDDLNGDAIEGIGFHDVNVGDGRRISTAVGYLLPAMRRPNLEVLTRTRARRILIENGRATGVEVERNGRRQTLRAEREIVLCGGAIQSPHLLMLSGIGPADHLRASGLTVHADLPGVGSNLRNHVNFQLQYACSKPVTIYRYLHPARALGCAAAYLWRRGPLADSFFAAGGYFRTDPSLDSPDIYVVSAPALLRHGGLDLRMRDLLPREHGFMVTLSLGRPRSQGHIRLRSGDPADRPIISPNYFDDPDDLYRLAKGVQMMRDMLQGPPVRSLISAELQPGPTVTDEAALHDAIRAHGGTSYHPMGTCRMGSEEGAVVDPTLRVHGVANLRVADASIMPTPVTATIHAPVIMIGEKAAAMMLQ